MTRNSNNKFEEILFCNVAITTSQSDGPLSPHMAVEGGTNYERVCNSNKKYEEIFFAM
jgi:hypothetical protein